MAGKKKENFRDGVIHLFRGRSDKSARLQYELGIDKGRVIEQMRFFDVRRIWNLMRSCQDAVLIFHQQSSLVNMIITITLRNFFSGNWKVVYDMHDILEFPSDQVTLKKITFFLIAWIAERYILSRNITVLTVSPEINELVEKKFDRPNHTIMNMTPAWAYAGGGRKEVSSGKRIVYFGAINSERFNLLRVQKLVDAGFSFDVFGIFTSDDFKIVFDNYFATNDKVRYMGTYSGQDILLKLEEYDFSWMVFSSSRRNIHYCLPNKLFQSLSVGLPCIIDDSMVSAKNLGNRGFPIITLDEISNVDIFRNVPTETLASLERSNRQEYLKAIAAST